MPVFTTEVLGRAELRLQAMDMAQKTALGDEIFRQQPNLLASVLVLQRFGSNMVEIETVLNVLFIVFEAMKSTGHQWPVITEAVQERGLERISGHAMFAAGLPPGQVAAAAASEFDLHPEPILLAVVWGKTQDAGWLSIPDEPTKCRVMCLFNLVECLSLVLQNEHRR